MNAGIQVSFRVVRPDGRVPQSAENLPQTSLAGNPHRYASQFRHVRVQAAAQRSDFVTVLEWLHRRPEVLLFFLLLFFFFIFPFILFFSQFQWDFFSLFSQLVSVSNEPDFRGLTTISNLFISPLPFPFFLLFLLSFPCLHFQLPFQ